MALKTIFNVSEEKTAKLAVLIDADNASAKDIKNILDEYVTIKLFDELNDWRKLRNDVTYKLTDSDEEYKKVAINTCYYI